jgi:predicted  nucleic acid-binding Zn-ribbon protein|nr:MAG TPA: Portal protein [Caudoviricetes sp.]
MPDKVSAVDMYLQWSIPIDAYVNTVEEQILLNKFVALFSIAKGAKESETLANSENIAKWRKAYYGTLGALNKDGSISKRKSRQLRKMAYEFVESKIDNNIPLPKMSPKYKSDLPLVQVTEDYLKYNIDNIFSKYLNDRSERSTYVDGTSWYKVWWDSLENSYDTSGTVKVDVCLADQIVPQPGVTDWRQLEYIFELQQISLSRIYKLFGRRITPISGDTSQTAEPDKQTDLSTITMITCYYLNEDRIVGRFAWAQHSQQVICNEHDWQIRKLRTCTKCGQIVPQSEECPICGSKSFKYEVAKTEILDEDLMEVYNPYDVGETDNPEKKDEYKSRVFLTKGTEIPYYRLRMLPFIPRPAVSSIESLYGVSEVMILLELQDVTNKLYTKMTDKTLSSGAIVTKPQRVKINDTDEGIKQVDVRTYEESQMVQTKQIMADTSQDIVAAQMLYDSAKASSGVTDSYQGKYDASATSGKAKEFAAMQTAGRIESLRIMKAAAFSGLYELVLKYLLAFSDESRRFVKVLPDGSTTEEEWNKYMFLDRDKYGQLYYRDDFSFSSDPAATLETNRVAMWQEIQSQFIQGAFGNPQDSRTLELFWNMMDQQQYPLAKMVLAGIKDNSQHLPPEIEQMLLQQPEILQQVIATMQQSGMMTGGGQGGARPNSGPEGNGATHAANVTRTNTRNQAAESDVTKGLDSGSTGGAIK